MERVQIIDDREFALEAVSECVVEVSHRDQIGWFGVNLNDDTDENPFAWTVDAETKTDDGILGTNPTATPELALEGLAAELAVLQDSCDEEEAKDPRNRLGALMQALPTKTNKSGWRRLGDVGAGIAKRGTKAFQEKTGQTGEKLKDGTGSFLGRASQKVSQGREKLQEGVAKANLAERRKSLAEAFSPSKQCERDGHLFDEVKLISTSGTLSRMCRRCHNIIKVDLDDGGLVEVKTDTETGETQPADEEPVIESSPNETPAEPENRTARVQIGTRRRTPTEG